VLARVWERQLSNVASRIMRHGPAGVNFKV
jgi:hypothetical protein